MLISEIVVEQTNIYRLSAYLTNSRVPPRNN